MADTAAHIVDRVIPQVPVRQWVFSLPYTLRFRLAFDSALFSEALAIMIRSVFEFLKRRAEESGITKAECGAVVFIQRFGSALNLNPHAHILVLDGVYASANEESPRFFPIRPPDSKDVIAVAERVAMRVAELLERREGATESDLEEPALAALYRISIMGRVVGGPNAGKRIQTAGEFHNERESFERNGSRCALVSGFSVHAGVSIRADDRKGLERLCKYAGRPPVAAERLSQFTGGRLSYRLKTPWRNGTTHVIYEPLELMGRLAVLVPAPRANLIRYFGVFGPAAKWRASVVPGSSEMDSATESCKCGEKDRTNANRLRNYSWAQLMKRVFEFDALACPDCSGRLRILAAIHPPANTRKILECMGLPSRAPPVAAAVSESTAE